MNATADPPGLEAIGGPLDGDRITYTGKPPALVEVVPDLTAKDAAGRTIVHRYHLGRFTRGPHGGEYVYAHQGPKDHNPEVPLANPLE